MGSVYLLPLQASSLPTGSVLIGSQPFGQNPFLEKYLGTISSGPCQKAVSLLVAFMFYFSCWEAFLSY